MKHENHNLQTINKKQTTIYLRTRKEKPPKVFDGIDEIVVIYFVGENGSIEPENKLNQDVIDVIYKLLDEGETVKAIADKLGIHKTTVYNYKNQRELKQKEAMLNNVGLKSNEDAK